MKIITIIGARPQFIKAAVVSRALRQHVGLDEIIVHTGQHFDANMSAVFFEELEIPEPQYHLGIGGGTHGQNTGRMLEEIEAVLLKEQPGLVLVYGDTDSTLAGSLAAAKLHIPVAHVEAGLRSFNRRMPEEINRVIADHTADHLFTPTEIADQNLRNEGIATDKIIPVGDVMYDAVLYYANRAALQNPSLLDLRFQPKQFVLATIHRAENADNPVRLKAIVAGLAQSTFPVIWPSHPRTKKQLNAFGIIVPANIQLTDPLGYLEMNWLEKNAALIATDSGGVQKEAYFHRVPCITLRDETEWIELVECGANQLVGSDPAAIAAALEKGLLTNEAVFKTNFYGDGTAGEQIAAFIRQLPQ